jgi:hypothetical protein
MKKNNKMIIIKNGKISRNLFINNIKNFNKKIINDNNNINKKEIYKRTNIEHIKFFQEQKNNIDNPENFNILKYQKDFDDSINNLKKKNKKENKENMSLKEKLDKQFFLESQAREILYFLINLKY